MSVLERTTEGRAIRLLQEVGAFTVKMSTEGFPDRLVLWGQGLHFWIEFKKKDTGRMRKLQELWKRELMKVGDSVYIVDDAMQIPGIILEWEQKHGPAHAG